MNATLPASLASALLPWVPKQSIVRKIVPDADAIDRAMHADKLTDGYNRRNDAHAMALQVKHGSAA